MKLLPRLLPWHYGARNLLRSPSRLAQTVGGSALVVLLFLASAGFVRGMKQSLVSPRAQNNVIILGAGSEESIERSEISPRVTGIVAAGVNGVAERIGELYISPEVHMASLVTLGSHAAASEGDRDLLAVLRGITPRAFLVHPEVRIIEGHAPRAEEVLVGRLAAAKLGVDAARLAPGETITFDERVWTISGIFEAPSTVMESEIWVDLFELQISSRRTTISCVIVTLDQAEFEDVQVLCQTRLDLEIVAVRESDYYAALFRFYRPVQALVWVTALLVALGGFLGGLNTMYAAYATRIRELATLQAIGFSRMALYLSLLQESLVIAATGSLIAAACAILFLDGVAVRLSMGAFGLSLDGPALGVGLGAGLALGLAGTLPPALRCLNVPIFQALKSA